MISLSTLVGDIMFTLNQLAKMDADTTSALRGRLDLERIGLFGHSPNCCRKLDEQNRWSVLRLENDRPLKTDGLSYAWFSSTLVT